MEVFTMVAIIVVASCGAGVLNNYMKMQSKRGTEEEQAGTLEELDELRRRVEVLEEIVTDEKYQLKSQLAALERNGN